MVIRTLRKPFDGKACEKQECIKDRNMDSYIQGRGKNLDMFLLTKGNFTKINEFKYGQT